MIEQFFQIGENWIDKEEYLFQLIDAIVFLCFMVCVLYLFVGNYILLCTISKTIKGHMIMYPFIIQSFFSFFFPFPSFLTLQERVFRKRGSRGSVFGL